MTQTLRLLLAATVALFAFNPVFADSYSDTVEVFRKAGESGAFFDNSEIRPQRER